MGLGMRTFLLRCPGYVIDDVVLMGVLVLEPFFGEEGRGLLVVFEILKEENKRLAETIGEKDKIIEKLHEDLDQYSTS
ncbi:uncharacterized protein Pyn_06185 [Prunus yedoensis var. nudiflora]|uniref:Uncharacterized protein n=1 Tax=Prunus yedoensis var. nudiflora TaxID=2094558 RepID=A0A314UI53_PRUYE|nr:uncharacterized protein Pyn_06185 [Prunus yedoensis var. nudiflora]